MCIPVVHIFASGRDRRGFYADSQIIFGTVYSLPELESWILSKIMCLKKNILQRMIFNKTMTLQTIFNKYLSGRPHLFQTPFL